MRRLLRGALAQGVRLFGTALAVYTFWVLLHNETRALFEPTPAA